MLAAYYFVSGIYLSFYLAICLDFIAFRRQFEAMAAQLNVEAEKGQKANQFVIKQKINTLIEHHIFMKE